MGGYHRFADLSLDFLPPRKSVTNSFLVGPGRIFYENGIGIGTGKDAPRVGKPGRATGGSGGRTQGPDPRTLDVGPLGS